MAQYEFTVRAKDETGAFADRTFNIEVQNNLVDKFVFNAGSDIYTSIDGSSWTKRGGHGLNNNTVIYKNGWWLVYDDSYINRRSKDGINWIHNTYYDITFTNLDPSFDDVLDQMYMWIEPHQIHNATVINGWAYYWVGSIYNYGSTTVGARALVRTKDFLEYEIVNYNGKTKDQIMTDGFFGNMDASAFNATGASNIIKKDDMYYMTSGINTYRSNDLTMWEEIGSSNNLPYTRLININGIVVALSTSYFASTGTDISYKVAFSTDMITWTESISGSTSFVGKESYGEMMFYLNGYFYIRSGSTTPLYKVSSDLQTWTDVNFNIGNTFSRPNFTYDGMIYFVDMYNVLWEHDPSSGTNTEIGTLPVAPDKFMGVLK